MPLFTGSGYHLRRKTTRNIDDKRTCFTQSGKVALKRRVWTCPASSTFPLNFKEEIKERKIVNNDYKQNSLKRISTVPTNFNAHRTANQESYCITEKKLVTNFLLNFKKEIKERRA